jgi:hypothetical protein
MTCSPHCNRCREDEAPTTGIQRVWWFLTRLLYRALLVCVFAVPIYLFARIPFPKVTYQNTVACVVAIALMAKLYDCLEAVDD